MSYADGGTGSHATLSDHTVRLELRMPDAGVKSSVIVADAGVPPPHMAGATVGPAAGSSGSGSTQTAAWRTRIEDFERGRLTDEAEAELQRRPWANRQAATKKKVLLSFYRRQGELIDAFVRAEERVRRRLAADGERARERERLLRSAAAATSAAAAGAADSAGASVGRGAGGSVGSKAGGGSVGRAGAALGAGVGAPGTGGGGDAEAGAIARAVSGRTVAAATAAAAAAAERQEEEDAANTSMAVKMAINLSFAANVCIFIAYIIAAAYSGSLAIVGAAIESSLDLVSGSIIYFAARAIARRNPDRYPVGKSRLEPISIVVFASILGVGALQLGVTALQSLVEGVQVGPPELRIDGVALGILVGAIATKFGLFLMCWRLAAQSPGVGALMLDHRNDIISNTFTIGAVLLASRVRAAWFVDPLQAIMIALLIVTTWASTGSEYIGLLTGKVADPEMLAQLTYVAFNHDARVRQIDTVRAYFFGSRLLVELDIVLPADMHLQEAHDIGESLQAEIERLEFVERAFVHLDYETGHRAHDEHRE